MRRYILPAAISGLSLVLAASPAQAQAGAAGEQAAQAEISALRSELSAARAQIDAQEGRLRALEARLSAAASPPAPPAGGSASTHAAAASQLESVGEAPIDFDRPPVVAVLGDQGAVITRRGQLTAEAQFEYARADRNRALFRGIELVESVLVGVFDINESRQDVLTASAMFRYGLTNRLEAGIRLPFVYRSNNSVLTPIQGSTPDDAAATIDSSAKGRGLGDVELSLRYQLTKARAGRPFLIGNLQVIAPTGSDPFRVPRDSAGRELRAATGAGFWGVSPSVTAILPSDPAVLFGTIGYTHNFGRDEDTEIPPVRITHVKPGDSLSLTGGIGVALNQRTSFNLGYAHSWAFGTKTRTMLLDPTPSWPGERSSRARQLQIGRFLFGMSYRVSDRASINWSVEVGATNDATDLRTVLRIPTVLLTGG